jgi:hypothetical protein
MARIDNRLTALATMSPARLREEWRQLHGANAPRLASQLLRHGIAYRLQEQAGKPLAASALRQLRPRSGPVPEPVREAVTLRPGAQLVRTWHGRTICVVVKEQGFLFDGQHYGSLTSIAREVTGAAWSGPRFFGLIRKAKP